MRFLLTVLLGGIALAPTLMGAASRPNIVFILCDDLGYGDLGCQGHPSIRTPHLDRLASEGLQLSSCYASAPVCSSSRAGLMTGRTPNRTGVYDWIPDGHSMHLPSTELTVATLLQRAGYATAHAGKWHLNGTFNQAGQPQPGDHGFQHWFATQNNAAPSHENPSNFVRNGESVGELEGYSCQLVAGEAIRWLKEGRDKDRPFFLNVWFHEPHEPVASPKKMVESYPGACNEDEAQYFANVSNMDAAVGRLLAALKEQGLDQNTLVWFSSDNGPETLNRYRGARRSYGSPGPLRGMKLHIYEGGIRVAGILRWPGVIAPGRKEDTPVCGVDFLPTAAALAGMEPPSDRVLDGMNLRPLLEGGELKRERPLFWAYYRALGLPKVAMRDGDWKIVAHWDGPVDPLGGNVNPRSMHLIKHAELTRMELYHLRSDWGETRDLSARYPDVLQRMETALRKTYLEVRAEGPEWSLPPEPVRAR